MIPCLCINDKRKPPHIPASHWVKQGHIYHIIDIRYLTRSNTLGVELEEIDLSEIPNSQYLYFDAKRFIIETKDLPALQEMIDLSKELANFDHIDIKQLLHEELFTPEHN